jgi:hypothetical protein
MWKMICPRCGTATVPRGPRQSLDGWGRACRRYACADCGYAFACDYQLSDPAVAQAGAGPPAMVFELLPACDDAPRSIPVQRARWRSPGPFKRATDGVADDRVLVRVR